MVPSFEQLIETGVDYVTATANTAEGRNRFREWGAEWLSSEVAAGNECRNWAGHGYSGLSSGSIQYGLDGDTALLRVSGAEANAKATKIVQLATNISRLDLQSTVRLNRDTPQFAAQLERRALQFKRKHNQRWEVQLLRNDVRGQTLYLGRRVSDRFIRVYNKHTESALVQYERCWRAEVQYGGRLANWRAKQLFETNSDATVAHELVYLECIRRGIPWLRLPKGTGVRLKAVPVTRLSSSDEQLAWLRSQVRPTVLKLVDRGRLIDVLTALGLQG